MLEKYSSETDRKHVIAVIKALPFFEGKSKKLEGKNIPCPTDWPLPKDHVSPITCSKDFIYSYGRKGMTPQPSSDK